MAINTSLNDRVAVITGAASGFGAATAQRLAAEGARIALLARRKDRLDAVVAAITTAGGTALPIAVDVRDASAVDAAAAQVATELGTADLVVNNAGVMLAHAIEDGRTDEWQQMIDTNIAGVLNMLRAFTQPLLDAGAAGRTADLVNVSSVGAHVAFPHYAVYGATKAFVTALSTSLRTEFGPRGVRVTNIEPGLGETELGQGLDGAHGEQLSQMWDAIGPLQADDIADLIAYTTSRPAHVNLRQVIVLPTSQA